MLVKHSSLAVLGLCAALLVGCGPSDVEVGQAMLLSAVPLAAITIGIEYLFVKIAYRRLDTRPRLSAAYGGALIAVVVVIAVAGLVIGGLNDGDYVMVVGAVLGAGYGNYLGPALVLAHLTRHRWASRVAVTVPIALVVASGLVLTVFGSSDSEVESEVVWVIFPLVWKVEYFVGVGMLALAFGVAWLNPHRPPPPIAPAHVVR